MKEWLLPKITNLQRMIRRRGVAEDRTHAFEQFFHNNVHVSRLYQTIDDLYLNPPSYDVYITGSDQVWNYDMHKTERNNVMNSDQKYKDYIDY